MAAAKWLDYVPGPKPLIGNNEYHVFLSYRSINRTWTLNLYDVLVGLGYKVFLDQYVLKPGDKLIQELQRALEKSQAGILIWSDKTTDSSWVNDEYETLQIKANSDPNFVFVPAKIDNSKLPLFAANRIHIDFTGYPDGPNGGNLLRLLYAINGLSLSKEAIVFANEQDETAIHFIALIDTAVRNKNATRLIALFDAGGLVWETSAVLGCKTAEALTRLGKYEEAITILEKLEHQFPKAIRPKQLKGLALARKGEAGDLEEAQEILGILIEKNHLDSETLGIYARTWMDRYNSSHQMSDLLQSRNYYAQAFDKEPKNYYPGINAASKSVFLGDMPAADAYANRVEEIVGKEAITGNYWATATVAEVMMIKKNFAGAAAMYQKAINMAPSEIGSINSTWKQTEILIQKLGCTDAEKQMLLNVFQPFIA